MKTRSALGILLIATIPTGVFAQKMDARWHELNKLVRTETEMLEKARKQGDEVHYRLLELYSERLKLVLEKENRAFLEAQDGKKHVNKDAYFNESLRLYNETRSYGEKLLGMYPDSPRRGAMYYTLGLNSRDYGRDNRTERYLLEAMRLIKPNSALYHHAQTSLADFYYNEKKFPQAIGYYEEVVKDNEDDWKPKHLLNLGWCYVKTDRHDDGIAQLKEAYKLSKDSRYVDIREQVLSHLAPFFVFANKIDDGREFYVKNEKDPMVYLLSLAKRAADKGHGKETEEILKTMQELIGSRGLEKHQEDLVLYELDFFRTYKRWDDHLRVSAKLLDLHKKALRQPELKLVIAKEDGIEKVRSVAGFLQLQTAKDVKKGTNEFGSRDLSRTVAYFNLLRELDQEKKDEYAYFIGETYYAVNQHENAAKAYRLGLDDSKKMAKPNESLQRKILNSLLAVTGEEVLAKNIQHDTLVYTYENHVDIFPKDDMSHKIYPKLFQLHRADKNDEQAVSAMERYNKNYPADLSKQQDLMKALMDDFIKGKDVLKITHWIGEFKKGFLKFDTQTIEQTEIILGQILFVKAQEQVARGEHRAALKSFEDVYKTTIYPTKVRALAGIQAGDIELDLADPVGAIPWMEKSIEILDKKELDEKTAHLTAMIERMAYMREFRGAVRLTDSLLKKSCSFKSKKQDRLWELSVSFHLVLADDWMTRQNFKETAACASSSEVHDKLASHVLWYYWDQNDSSKMISFYDSNKKNLNRDDYVSYLLDLYWDQPEQGQQALRVELKHYKDHPKVVTLNDDFKHQEKFQARRAAILKTELLEAEKPFDGDAFNAKLEAFMLEIKKVGEEVKPLLTSEHGKIREQTNQQLQGFYADVADKLQGLKPNEPDKDFQVSFQAEMYNVAKVFQTKVVDFKKATRRPSGDVTFASPLQPTLSISPMDQIPGGRK
ncbi:MAG: tetratricopeptide repeat protein [Bacteriovoracaceae bacterium]|nr:tetratricopeptide repeat protein [Bacteriovoracaceae bacterium]